MRKLHLVGLTTDRDGLIFTARKGSKSGGYIVPLDDKVLAAIAEARNVRNGAPADVQATEIEAVPKRLRSESALTPREMQARLRAGRSIEEVAAEAGVDTEWVARFAVPILAEQAQVVELARALVYAKPRLGESSQPLGASVLMNLSDRGVFLPDDVAHTGWSAFQLHDSVWMVRYRYRSRGREQEAQWEIDVPTGRLLARNRHASDLGYVEPGRRRRDVEAEQQVEEQAAEPAPPASRAARRTPKAPTVKKAPAAKRAAAARRAAPVTTKARRAPSVPARSTAKATKGARKVAARKATPVPAKAAGKQAPAKSTSRRRPAKAAPPSESGPTAGSGGVRMAVAQVSTARVAASLAAADRAPWAAAVRRPQRSDGPRPRDRESDRESYERAAQAAAVPTFQPRPLPPHGAEPVAARVRKVTVRTRSSPAADGPPAVSLPATRTRTARQEPPKPIERPKRRRLRSR